MEKTNTPLHLSSKIFQFDEKLFNSIKKYTRR